MRGVRWLLLVLVLLLGWLQYRKRENTGLQERNDALAAEVEDLKSGEAAVEERARSELGMIKPGEKFYRVVEPVSSVPLNENSDDGASDSESEAETH